MEFREENSRIEQLERGNKRNNLVIKGLEIETNNSKVLKESLEDFITRHMQVPFKLRRADKIYVMETEDLTDKINILKNKTKFMEIKERKIYINSDMTKTEREIQSMIRKQARVEREEGKQIKIGHMKLTIDGMKSGNGTEIKIN